MHLVYNRIVELVQYVRTNEQTRMFAGAPAHDARWRPRGWRAVEWAWRQRQGFGRQRYRDETYSNRYSLLIRSLSSRNPEAIVLTSTRVHVRSIGTHYLLLHSMQHSAATHCDMGNKLFFRTLPTFAAPPATGASALAGSALDYWKSLSLKLSVSFPPLRARTFLCSHSNSSFF